MPAVSEDVVQAQDNDEKTKERDRIERHRKGIPQTCGASDRVDSFYPVVMGGLPRYSPITVACGVSTDITVSRLLAKSQAVERAVTSSSRCWNRRSKSALVLRIVCSGRRYVARGAPGMSSGVVTLTVLK